MRATLWCKAWLVNLVDVGWAVLDSVFDVWHVVLLAEW